MQTPMRALVLAFALSPLFAGCDLIADLAGAPDEVDVSAGSAGRLDVIPASTTVSSSDVNVGQDLPDVFDVDGITLPEGSVTFTPATPTLTVTRSAADETCLITLSLFVDGVRAADGQVTVDVDGSTATVTQASVQFASGYTASDVCGAFPGGTCPATSGTYTRQQIQDAVTAAIQSGRFDLDIAAQNPGACQGTLKVETLRFGLSY